MILNTCLRLIKIVILTEKQCDSDTEFWTDDSTRCLCSAGLLYCFHSQCPKNQICEPPKNDSVTSTSGICTIYDNSHYTTFDGMKFDLMSPCPYVLAKTCSPSEVLPRFSVKMVNMQNGNGSLTTIQKIIVDLMEIEVSLLESQTNWVAVSQI